MIATLPSSRPIAGTIATMAATTWVALLRGINLGRARRVAMADLRSLLVEAGYEDVKTLLQSGNVVFSAGGTAPKLEKDISAAIDRKLGMDVRVLVRSAKEFESVAEANPFAGGPGAPAHLVFGFVRARPAATKVKALDPSRFEPDEYAIGDRVIYERRPNGVMGS